jgi:hypothetical protein
MELDGTPVRRYMTMRTTISGIVSCCTLLPLLAFAQTNEATCARSFEAAFQPGGTLDIRVRPGDIDIAGSDQAKVSVSCGGPRNDVRIRIQVPRNSHLFVRSPAGDLTVSDVIGNKDMELHAGDLTIAVGQAGDYAHADASVMAGDLTASAFGVNKDGLFRSFEQNNPSGKYRLHAHVGAGDLTLK